MATQGSTLCSTEKVCHHERATYMDDFDAGNIASKQWECFCCRSETRSRLAGWAATLCTNRNGFDSEITKEKGVGTVIEGLQNKVSFKYHEESANYIREYRAKKETNRSSWKDWREAYRTLPKFVVATPVIIFPSSYDVLKFANRQPPSSDLPTKGANCEGTSSNQTPHTLSNIHPKRGEGTGETAPPTRVPPRARRTINNGQETLPRIGMGSKRRTITSSNRCKTETQSLYTGNKQSGQSALLGVTWTQKGF
ncbi:hypothetical protein Bbelb_416910 [Branchiostoma belcheri]|nr:hypothetical protein Bbelb_416910 [Branchiostoma belcheri]